MQGPWLGPEKRAPGDHQVQVAQIRDQLTQLQGMRLHLEGAVSPSRRNFDCYLQYSSTTKMAARLGPLARWLVAIDLLTLDELPTTRIPAALQLEGVLIRRMFGCRDPYDRPLKNAARFMVQDLEATDDTDREMAEMCHCIIGRLNDAFARQRLCPITLHEFLTVPVPLNLAAADLGEAPIEWFRHWLQWGTGTAALRQWPQQPAMQPLPTSDTFAAGWREIVQRLLYSQRDSARAVTDASLTQVQHPRIINVHSESTPGALASFAAAAHVALAAEVTADPQLANIKIAYLSVGRIVTRLGVLQKLYECFGLDRAALQPIEQGQRGLDLVADLEPVRRALTSSAIVLIFECWETTPSRFGTLHEYLRNSDLSEMLRVLAHPHFATVRSANARLQPSYRLMVVSQAMARELGPWAQYIELAHLWSPPAQTTPGDSQEGASANALLDMPIRKDFAASAECMAQWFLDCEFDTVEVLVLCLIAVSSNGMRRGTLQRCVAEWNSLFGGGRLADAWLPSKHAFRDEVSRLGDNPFNEKLDALLVRCGGVVVEVKDEEIESLSAEHREVELNTAPWRTSPQGVPGPAIVLDLASNDLRAVFVSIWAEWVATEQLDPASTSCLAKAQQQLHSLECCSWAHVNFLLAEECLRQASTQLRHATVHAPMNVYSLRRSVQALVHGLASLTLSEPDFKGRAARSGGLYGPALPSDAHKRYLFLYSFLYRKVIEGEEWRLGRSFNRSDLRLALLNMLVAPGVVPVLFGARGTCFDGATLPDYPLASSPNTSRLASVEPALEKSQAMWADLVEAIGRAGSDAGGEQGFAAVRWALERLPRPSASARVHAALPASDSRRLQTLAAKLAVDWYLSRRDPELLVEAEQTCWRHLISLGVDKSLIEETLFRAADDALRSARADQKEVRGLLLERFESIQVQIEKTRYREEAADFLFRLGEILATRADDEAFPLTGVTGERITQKFVRALGVYWLADRVRSDAGTLEDDAIRWPRAPARAMHHYVQVILTLARHLSREHPPEGAALFRMTTHLLEQAQNRIGVYTRHNFHLRRERDSILTLEAARLRAWIRVALERSAAERLRAHQLFKQLRNLANPNLPGRQNKLRNDLQDTLRQICDQQSHVLASLRDVLDSCWNLLHEVEAVVISLGFQIENARQLLLERTRTAIAALYVGAAELEVSQLVTAMGVSLSEDDEEAGAAHEDLERCVATYDEVAISSLNALAAASISHSFWTEMANRQRIRVAEARNACKVAAQDPTTRASSSA